MTDTGQVPGEGLPENAGMVEQPGVLAPGAYTYLDPSDSAPEDDDLLLMPGQQGAWGNEMPQHAPAPAPYPHEPGPHEAAGRDSGSIDVGAVRTQPPAPAPQSAPRRPLHLGPPIPDTSASPVRTLSDRGPADAPMRASGPPTTGPEYLDVPQLGDNSPQGAVPWGPPPQQHTVPPVGPEGTAAETVFPAPAPEPAPTVQPTAAPVAPEAAPVTAETAPEAQQDSGPLVDSEPQQAPQPTPEAPQAAHAVPASEDAHAVPAPEGALGMPEEGRAEVADDAGHVLPDGAPDDGSQGDAWQGDGSQGDAWQGDGSQGDAWQSGGPQGDAWQSGGPQHPGAVAAPDAAPVQAGIPAGLAPQVPDVVPMADATPDFGAVSPVDGEPHSGAAAPAAEAGPAQQAAEAHVPAPTTHPTAPAEDHEPVADAPAEEEVHDPGQAPAEQVHDPSRTPAAAPAPDEHAILADTEARTPDTSVPFAEPAPQQGPEEVQPEGAESAQAGPVVGAAQAHGEQEAGGDPAAVPGVPADAFGVPADAAGVQADAPVEPQADQSFGRFVPVEGTVPTTPHLAPTPPHALTVPPLPAQEQPSAEESAPAVAQQEEPAVQEPVAMVPGPREGEAPASEPHAEDPETVVAQQADDLDTRAADQEESTAAVEDARQSTGPAAPGYDDAEREAVLRVMRERRDIRNGFRSDPIPHDVLLRVLEAAHTAPSVGHSQPWDFVVIRSAETRRTMHELAMRQREAYAKSLPKGRAKQFKELKIEAILDTPVNIVVTADPTRGGRHTLGRHTQPQMAPYSSALAVENLWLAARAEGLGVGWVSFFDEREMVRALGLPEHLEVVAYLCVGYVDEFPEEPELMQAGWSKRRPLSWVVHEETYGRRALPGEEPHDLLAETVAGIRPLDAKALGEAWERQKRMTKPAGALGMLEIISAQLSGLSRQCPPPIPEPAAVAIFAGDHGVHAQGVTPWPQEVTGQMVANFLGGGAVCNAFAGQVGAEVCVIDVGVAADLPATPGLLPRKVRAGTADMTTGPALTREEVKQAIEVGIETARDLVAAGNKALLTGEMGIANTTASAALIAVFTDTDPSEVTGRGTGINDETLARKTEVVRRAIELHQPDPADPIGVLAAFGGLEHAAMVGLLLGGASLRTPVILDGVSAGAAALVARAIAPEVLAACIAGHRSAEPGHVAALNKLGLRPLVDLDLRLGEGTGALLALPLVQSAARAMHEVATFDSAGVTEK
ncbi:nicotinate-nucleotide--dimethylbenzimidazole phosphoribosyltransferase [Streptomyces sp. NPDC001796]|uniref:nicotinate-nucleotide--dimethylbenzimidazole phosphoribosyltransferase n=1 Tax=Streptomyces sp. NPDC001796 TaxID=3364609 RepID=UPI0036C7FE8A